MVHKKPYLLQFESIGDDKTGYHSYAEYASSLPFETKRVFWMYNTPEEMSRVNSANAKTKNVFVCLHGKASFYIENVKGKSYEFTISSLDMGLYIPEMHWKRITLSDHAVLLGMSSEKFEEVDFIRDFAVFKQSVKRKI